VVFVAIGIAVEITLLPKASSASTTTTSTGSATSSIYCSVPSSTCVTPTTTVQSAVNEWVADFNARNVPGISNFYAQDASVTWTGGGSAGSGLDGTYNGLENIKILYGSSIGKTTSLDASVANFVNKTLSPDEQNVTLTLAQKGNSSVVGALTISVDATQLWQYSGGQWQIVKETWNYVTFNEEFPVAATTFPQWTAIKEGLNPNLVEEKSFEWHAGPYVAASLYAFLFGIVGLTAMKYRSARRKQTG
jgi:ketosteroid isomerase-like protein